jgi:hypothetical protein
MGATHDFTTPQLEDITAMRGRHDPQQNPVSSRRQPFSQILA